ncbi:hypothetical protein LEMLEM_LOCUS20955 [Lemmus lemmus]
MCAVSAGRPSARGITWRCTSAATQGRNPISVRTAGRASAGGSTCWCIAGHTLGRSPTPASVARASAGMPTWQCTGVHTLGRSPMAARYAASVSARGSGWCGTRGSTRARSPTTAPPAAAASTRGPSSTGIRRPSIARSPLCSECIMGWLCLGGDLHCTEWPGQCPVKDNRMCSSRRRTEPGVWRASRGLTVSFTYCRETILSFSFFGGRWLGTHFLSKFGGKGKILLHIGNLKLIFLFVLR